MSDNLSPYSAIDYEEGMRKTMPFYESIYSETISLVQCLKPDLENWLDTGCGPGSLIARAFPTFNNARFLLADPSEEMLNKARKTLSEIPPDQLKIVGSVGTENLPKLNENIPQVATAILAHHYFNKETRQVATNRCFELLDAQGVYITFENIYPSTEVGKDIGLRRWKQFQMLQGKTEEEAENHLSRYNRSFFPITIEEHLKILKEAGFRMAELFWFSYMQAGFYAIK
jgi:tRNA (cmo5U34)-methyltransferase